MKGEANMKIGIAILQQAEDTIKTIAAFHDRVQNLYETEARAEREGNIEAAMTAFTERMQIILAGPGASQATAWA